MLKMTKIVNEGGNVVPDAKELTKQNFPSVMNNLKAALPKGLNLYPIGSAGHKEVSSDIDVLVDAAELMQIFPAKELKLSRQQLEQYFKSKGMFAARTGVSVHVGVPIGNTKELVQVDIMAVENAAAAQPLHTHDYSRDPKMKGGTLHAIWADLANMSSTPENNLMMSPYKGLVNRDTKQLITANKDEIAKQIIGPNATAADMSSVDAILDALKPYPAKYKAIKDKYTPISDSISLGLGEQMRYWINKLS
jgi:tetrahydromethanopterin S-methyltransferase subunit B